MEIRPFGVTGDGRAVEEILLDNGRLRCSLLTYGAVLRGLTVPGADGPVDVALGFDRMEDYLVQDKYIGAVVGRYANRIAGGRFTLDGQEYRLACNDGDNHLHGGPGGFFTKVWQAEPLDGEAVRFTCTSEDMEEGYPGRLTAQAVYCLAEDRLILELRAGADRPTVCSLTSHAYFDLNGHGSGRAMDQWLTLYAHRYTPTLPGSIPTGELAEVEGTPMDFLTPHRIGERIDQPFAQLQLCGGYDHNWVVDGLQGALRPAARLEGPDTGICMELSTTLPGVQFYAGNYLDGCPAGKGGAPYGHRDGICLEAQLFPDSPNQPAFPSCVLRPGESWVHTIVWRFSKKR